MNGEFDSLSEIGGSEGVSQVVGPMLKIHLKLRGRNEIVGGLFDIKNNWYGRLRSPNDCRGYDHVF